MTFEPRSSKSIADLTKNRVAQLWWALSQRNQWLLIDDINAWIEQVVASLPDAATLPDQQIVFVLRGKYSMRLYRDLLNRDDRAAQELWLICSRLASKKLGLQSEDAEDVAQETVTRVLEKLIMLRSPQALLAWVLQILRTVVRDQRRHEQRIESSLDEIDTSSMDVEDPAETPTDWVEQSMIREELLNVLKSKLPNKLERLIMLRIVVYGDDPRDVAQDLDLPLHRLRLVKSRALQRLRGNEEFIRQLAELADRTDAPSSL